MKINSKVYLVGAGPGDVELLTLKAARLLDRANVVVYDRLVSDDVMTLVNPDADCRYVGKRTHNHTLDQAAINRMLVDLSHHHEHIVRLKGGDPFVFGRGGEEAQALAQAGVAFEVVPGITSAQACAAYSGIPLTHRGLSRGVQFLTGHFKKNAPLHWSSAAIADPEQTLVIYMALENIDTVVRELVAAGRSPDTPAAIVENGTTDYQRRVITQLDHLPLLVSQEQIEAPAMLIIGNVVSLSDDLDWFSPSNQLRQELYCAQA